MGVLGHRQQRVQRQHGHAGAEAQALGHRAGGAQAGEGARPAAERNAIQLRQLQPGPGQQAFDGRDQAGRGLRAAGTVVGEQRRPRARLQGNGEQLGAGIEGKQFHAGFRINPALSKESAPHAR
jgi:hypothetical protein